MHCKPVSGMPKDPDRRRLPAALTSMAGGLAVPLRYRAIGVKCVPYSEFRVMPSGLNLEVRGGKASFLGRRFASGFDAGSNPGGTRQTRIRTKWNETGLQGACQSPKTWWPGTELNFTGVLKTRKSDTHRKAGGLMSWAASEAVGHRSRRRAEGRLG